MNLSLSIMELTFCLGLWINNGTHFLSGIMNYWGLWITARRVRLRPHRRPDQCRSPQPWHAGKHHRRIHRCHRPTPQDEACDKQHQGLPPHQRAHTWRMAVKVLPAPAIKIRISRWSSSPLSADKLREKKSHARAVVRAHHQGEADRIISILARDLGLPDAREDLGNLKKSDPRKGVYAGHR